MKSKFIAALLAATFTCGFVSAATISLTEIANTSVGFVTAGASATLLTGSVTFYTSTTDLATASFVSFAPGSSATTAQSAFTGLLASPVSVRTNAFTNGVLAGTGSVNVNPGDFGYVFFASTDGTYYGIFQTPTVPATGSITVNPATILEDFRGTSTLTNVGGTNSGFQLVAIPEPSAALLGMLGALGLLRRRR